MARPHEQEYGRPAVCSISILSVVLASMGCLQFGGDAPYECDRIDLEVTHFSSRFAEGYRVWDVEIKVTATEKRTISASWNRLNAIFYTSRLLDETSILPYNGTHPERRGVDLYYIDSNGEPDAPDPGDILLFFGMSRAHQGAEVRLCLRQGLQAGSFYLPPLWNETFFVQIGALNVTAHPEYASIWNVAFEVQAIEPTSERVPWSDVYVGIIDHGYLVENLTRSIPVEARYNYSTYDYVLEGGGGEYRDVTIGNALSLPINRPHHPEGWDLMLISGTAILGFVRLPVKLPATGG